MSIEHVILGILSLNPLSGYQVKKIFAGTDLLPWSGNNNQIYTTLIKLHERGLVSREDAFREEGPSRRIYSITVSGRVELKGWLLSEPEPVQLRNAFLVQLTWADQLKPQELDSMLLRYEDETKGQAIMLRERLRRSAASPSEVSKDSYIDPAAARTKREALLWEMIQKNRISFYEHETNWVRGLRARLSELE